MAGASGVAAHRGDSQDLNAGETFKTFIPPSALRQTGGPALKLTLPAEAAGRRVCVEGTLRLNEAAGGELWEVATNLPHGMFYV